VAPRTTHRTVWLDIAALVSLAALVRLPALFTDFWYDEILSLETYARPARSAFDIFFNPVFKHDNNHQLNTLFMFWMGDHDQWVLYRLPVFAAGLGVVALATWVGGRRSRATGVFSGLFVACSFLMVVYSTEARGYGLLLLFVLLAFVALARYLEQPTVRRAPVFWLWMALGLTAHLTMVHFYLAALFWSGYRLRGNTRALMRLHAVPMAMLALWALAVLRGTRAGGGDAWSWRAIVDQSLGWSVGYPLSTVPAALGLALAAGLVVFDAWRLWRKGSDEGLFYGAVVLGPPVLVAALAPPYLFPRYFLVSLLFLLLIIARSFGRLWGVWGDRRRRSGLVAAATLLVGLNLAHLVEFVHDDRGHPADVVRLLADGVSTPEILVASPSLDDWSELPIRFYERVLHLGDRIHLVPREGVGRPGHAPGGVDWIVRPSDQPIGNPPERLALAPGEEYALRVVHENHGPSGLAWVVYQRVRNTP
jgi:hypothetical protein